MGLLIGGVALGAAGAGLSAWAAEDTKRKMANAAEMPYINPAESQDKALTGNLSNFGKTKDLVGQQNQFSYDELQKYLEGSIPGYKAAQTQRVQNASDKLKGLIPDDVAASIRRADAAHSLEGGYAGSGMARNLTARDFGRTSLDLMNQGSSDFSNIIGSTPMAQMSSTGNYMITPSDVYSMDVNQRNQKQQALMKAAQEKGWQGSVGNSASQIGGSMLGGA